MEVLDFNLACGYENVQGTKTRVYVACSEDIDVFPARLGTTNLGDKVTLDGDITLVTGKKFAAVDVIVESGKVYHSLKGPTGSQGWNAMFDFKLIAKGAEAADWVNRLLNSCLVWVIPQNDGTMRVIGSVDNPSKLTAAEHTDGQTGDDEKTYACTIANTDNKIAPFYTGAIDLTV
jgi:hypothetical protein